MTTRPPRIYLSPPHMSPAERELLLEAFDSNWIAPLGPHVNEFEKEFALAVDVPYAVALSSGTAALHLALLMAGVGSGDEVALSTLTFAATANAVHYVNATPLFVDSEQRSWNLDPNLLEDAIRTRERQGRPLKAVIAVDVFGQCADYDSIERLCATRGIPLIEDAAEALGALYRGRAAGAFGDMACFSFNGNKIITTSGGGMFVTSRRDWAERIRHLATQARDPAPHYEHSEIGYNYRLSNLLAAIGRGQLRALPERIETRRQIFEYYRSGLEDLPGLSFMPEHPEGRASRWLTCITIESELFGATPDQVRVALEQENIEARPVWKPMHLQPVFQRYPTWGGDVAAGIFRSGLCLPSGSNLSSADLARIVQIVRSVHVRRQST